MILFWNRQEIYCGYSLTDFNKVRTRLLENDINYNYKIINLNSFEGFDTKQICHFISITCKE